VNVGVLGTVGVGFLAFTALSLVHKVEEAFNAIWRIRHGRGFAQRFAAYLSVLLIGPLLVFAALGVTASLMSTTVVQKLVAVAPFGTLLHLGTRALPYLLVIAAFTVTYVFIPNTRVRPSAALVGGVVAGLLWETVGWGFGTFMVGSTKYTAIYSGFAILVLFMVWVFLNWLILLVGASVAFYVQHPAYQRGDAGTPAVSGRTRERLALLAMVAVGRRHHDGEAPWTLDGLTAWLAVPTEVTGDILEALRDRDLLLTTGDDPAGYVPARDLERIAVAEVLRAVRDAGDAAPYPVPAEPAVDGLVERLEGTLREALGPTTLRDLVRSRPAETAPAPGDAAPAGAPPRPA
jgi:membrane protein